MVENFSHRLLRAIDSSLCTECDTTFGRRGRHPGSRESDVCHILITCDSLRSEIFIKNKIKYVLLGLCLVNVADLKMVTLWFEKGTTLFYVRHGDRGIRCRFVTSNTYPIVRSDSPSEDDHF